MFPLPSSDGSRQRRGGRYRFNRDYVPTHHRATNSTKANIWLLCVGATLLAMTTVLPMILLEHSMAGGGIDSSHQPDVSLHGLKARPSKEVNHNQSNRKTNKEGTFEVQSSSELRVEEKQSQKSVKNQTVSLPNKEPNTKEETPTPIATVAHAISFLKCRGQKVKTYKDALLVLRHSIHQNSIYASPPKSRYAYKMYAFINSDPASKCERFAPWFQQMGYTPLLVANPVNISAITTNDHYRDYIDKTGVAGSSEFIKLYAYTLTDHPIAVHWDIDIVVMQPMDDLFDAIMFSADSEEGQRARSRLQIQQPKYQKVPDKIDAFFTRDVALARPWENRQVVQGGFLVARPDPEVLESYKRIVMEANYSGRCGNRGGWGDLGYGCKMGSMHYQGIAAYFYDQIAASTGVELDGCYWNQVAHAVIYESDKLTDGKDWKGYCQQSPIYGGLEKENRPEFGACHDCRLTPIAETKTAHFTACGKPWQCRSHPEDTMEAVNGTTCGLLNREFFMIREDLESQLEPLVGAPITKSRDVHPFHPEYFLGYCQATNKKEPTYRAMKGLPEDFQMNRLYGF